MVYVAAPQMQPSINCTFPDFESTTLSSSQIEIALYQLTILAGSASLARFAQNAPRGDSESSRLSNIVEIGEKI